MVNILSIINSAIFGLMNLSVLILVILTIKRTKNEELGSDCKKRFSKSFISFLLFLLFATFFDFAFSITQIILWEIYEIHPYSSDTIQIIWGIKSGLVFLNLFIAFILLFSSMEIYLFNKKSKWKFGILSILLLCGVFLLIILEIVMYYVYPFRPYNFPDEYVMVTYSQTYAITRLVVVLSTNFIYLIIGIVAIVLLKKTAIKNELLRKYTNPLSKGIILFFIALPVLHQLESIITFINIMMIKNGSLSFNNNSYWFNLGIFFISGIVFIIGMIFLALGNIQTILVPLTFSRKKVVKYGKIEEDVKYGKNEEDVKYGKIEEDVKYEMVEEDVKYEMVEEDIKYEMVEEEVPRESEETCSECGALIPFGAVFCIQCGKDSEE